MAISWNRLASEGPYFALLMGDIVSECGSRARVREGEPNWPLLVDIFLRPPSSSVIEMMSVYPECSGRHEMAVWARESRWKVALTSEELLQIRDRCGDEIPHSLPLVVADSDE